ncbi:hypothetical protein BJ170DRAFT_592283 [Xylariales sp. AK1849]|nr:hypothetical protein BJ170DRAFT_592283 [Xylariales sp. AK1849]
MLDQGSFRAFSLLPTEIRLEIWQYSCHQRVVEISYDAEKDQCTTVTTPPSVLYSCSESRREALRIYKRLFGTKTHEARIYFHPGLDTLYLPRPGWMGYGDSSRDLATLVTGTSEVLNLALDHVNPAIRRPWETYNKYVLMQSLPQVMEVYIVLDKAEPEPEPEPEKPKQCFLRLAEPCGDRTSICKLLADVKESFSLEAGPDSGIGGMDEATSTVPALVLKSMVETDYLRLL